MNLIRTVLGLLLLLPLALATGCNETGGSDESLTLVVTVSDWNGWDPDHESTPETTTVEVGEGDTFEAKGLDVTFEVTAIGDEEIELEASASLSPRSSSGGIDLNNPVDEFSFDRDETLELATPTTDAGDNIAIEVA